MQSFQYNAEASSQTFLSIPPHCTREMLRKAGDSLGTVNGVSYKEYFDDSSHTVLTPSPKRYSIHDTKKEEICYKVSSVFNLREESEVKTTEREYSEECVQLEDDGRDKDAEYVVEHPDVCTLKVAEVPAIGSQGDAALSENLQDTSLEKNAEFSHSISPPSLEKGDDYNFDTERSTLSDSEHSLVSSTKVEVGSQPDLGSVAASSYELVSLIGSSLVSKPLMEAQSEGKCQKKKKPGKNLKRVSKSVPHVVPEEMHHLNDFSRVVTQEAIYAEMSSGDDAFGANQDQYEDEEESSYSSESDDDASQTNSQEIDDLAIESSSSFPAPIAPPGSATSSPDGSSSLASRPEDYQATESGSTLQDESSSKVSCGQGSVVLQDESGSRVSSRQGSMGLQNGSRSRVSSRQGILGLQDESGSRVSSRQCSMGLQNGSRSRVSSRQGSVGLQDESGSRASSRQGSVGLQDESGSRVLSRQGSVGLQDESGSRVLSRQGSVGLQDESGSRVSSRQGSVGLQDESGSRVSSRQGSVSLQDESGSRVSSRQDSPCLELLTDSYMDQLGGASSEGLMSNILEHPEISLSSLSPDHNTDVENSKSPSPTATGSATTPASSRQEERESKAKRLEKLVEKLCQDFVSQNPAVKHNPASLLSYFENAGAVIRSLPIADLQRSVKNVSKDTAAARTPANKSQASSESSQVGSLESIRQSRR